MKILPKARTKDIVLQQIGNETLVYDLVTHKAYNLNETAAKVFNACNGKQTFDELKAKHQFTDDLIYLALDELKANNLIENYQSNYFAGSSRREVIKKVGLASMMALPVISAMVAPTAAQGQSCLQSNATYTTPLTVTCGPGIVAICQSEAATRCCSGQYGSASCSQSNPNITCSCA